MRVFPFLVLAALLSVIAGQTTQTPEQSQSGASVVEGVILNEITKEPIRRVAVQLTLWPDSLSDLPPGTTPQSMPAVATSTDAQGKFRFEDVAPGRYRISYQRQGFMGQRRGPGGVAVPGGDTITVSQGLELKGLRYTLIPQAVLAGRVLDDEGEPVQGARVTVVMRRFVNGKREWMPSGGHPTNDRGEFRLNSIPPGRVLIAAQPGLDPTSGSAPGRRTDGAPEDAVVATYYPNAVTPEQASPIEVEAGAEVTNLDITLQRREAYRIRGKALDVAGKPLEGFYITLIRTDHAQPLNSGRFMPKPNGEFEIMSVANGSYTMILQARSASMDQPRFATGRVDVSGSNVEGVTLQVKPGVNISGFVSIEGPGEKLPLGGIQVVLAPVEGRMWSFGGMPATTKDDGSFTITNALAGRYLIHAYGPLIASTYRAGTTVGGATSRGSAIEVSGADVSDVRILFRTDGGSIKGTAEGLGSPDGGIQQVMAVMRPVDKELAESMARGDMLAVVSRSGDFQFASVPPGEYKLWVIKDYEPGALQDAEIYQQVESKAVTVKVRAGETAPVSAKVIEMTLE